MAGKSWTFQTMRPWNFMTSPTTQSMEREPATQTTTVFSRAVLLNTQLGRQDSWICMIGLQKSTLKTQSLNGEPTSQGQKFSCPLLPTIRLENRWVSLGWARNPLRKWLWTWTPDFVWLLWKITWQLAYKRKSPCLELLVSSAQLKRVLLMTSQQL